MNKASLILLYACACFVSYYLSLLLHIHWHYQTCCGFWWPSLKRLFWQTPTLNLNTLMHFSVAAERSWHLQLCSNKTPIDIPSINIDDTCSRYLSSYFRTLVMSAFCTSNQESFKQTIIIIFEKISAHPAQSKMAKFCLWIKFWVEM